MRSKYSFGLRVRSSWAAGSRYEASHPGALGLLLEGENLAVDPPHRLVQSFRALWSEDVKREGTSRVTWEIEPVGGSCGLIVTHGQLRQGAHDELYGGWPMILSGLKTLLETGELLETPAPSATPNRLAALDPRPETDERGRGAAVSCRRLGRSPRRALSATRC